MLTLQQIINEVDTLVPNPFDVTKKVTWLNELNKDFFEIVKIPLVYQFTTTSGQPNYTLPSEIKSQHIKRVLLKYTIYNSMQYEDANPGHNFWIVDDTTKVLTLNPTPSLAGDKVIVRYNKTSKTTFLPSGLSVTPDAPEEYHWAFVLGLCERVAQGLNDVTLANNYGSDYRSFLSIAQQNYNVVQSEG